MNLRRNYLTLFDSMKNETVRLDVTLGISLLDRSESQKLQDKIEKSTVSGIEGPVNIRSQQLYPPERKPYDGRGGGGQSVLENLDPNSVIREGTTKVEPAQYPGMKEAKVSKEKPL